MKEFLIRYEDEFGDVHNEFIFAEDGEVAWTLVQRDWPEGFKLDLVFITLLS